jgi:hypothetical protein
MSTKDGGAAFPRPFSDNGGDTHERYEWAQEGMSLRDYFAAAALPEALRQEATSDEGKPCMYDVAAVARVAYNLADALIARRKATGGG